MEILKRASVNLKRPAIVHKGVYYTYEALANSAEQLSKTITATVGQSNVDAPRIGLHAAPGPEYVIGTLAVWRSGGIVVPLATSHPPSELSYVLGDAGISMVLAREDALSKVADVASEHNAGVSVIIPPSGSHRIIQTQSEESAYCASTRSAAGEQEVLRQVKEYESHSAKEAGQGALIIYTSGTTGKPKGVLHTHKSLLAQMLGLCAAWEWTHTDSILHTLPLHHIHGIVNALYCPLYSGARVDIQEGFAANAVWSHLMEGQTSVMMGVPPMYNFLLNSYDTMSPDQKAKAAASAAALRLTVCGSSACPVPVMQKWKALSGQYLLERYGMTEIGMALSNPYKGERRPGSVGLTLPGVQARIADDGELLIKGPNVFTQYWGRPSATEEAFTADGYFKTGDTASLDPPPQPTNETLSSRTGRGGTPGSTDATGQEGGVSSTLGTSSNMGLEAPGVREPSYSILGRTSVDIIKCAGYKVSALQVEGIMLEHPDLAEIAVLGLPHKTFGQIIVALVVPQATSRAQQLSAVSKLQQQQKQKQQQEGEGDEGQRHNGSNPTTAEETSSEEGSPDPGFVASLRAHADTQLAPYQKPRKYLVTDKLPRNAMGKVNKKDLLKSFFPMSVSA